MTIMEKFPKEKAAGIMPAAFFCILGSKRPEKAVNADRRADDDQDDHRQVEPV